MKKFIDWEWIIGTLITIVLSIIWWLYFSDNEPSQANDWNNNIQVAQDSGTINLNVNQAWWDIYNVKGNFIKNSTEIENEYKKMQFSAKTNLEAFFRRRERGDILGASRQLDKYMLPSPFFQTWNMTKFITEYLVWGFYLDEILPLWDCQSSKYIDRCEFDFKLRYVNKQLKRKVIEKWHVEMLINKDEYDYFKVWKLNCIDKNCENNPLFD